VNTQDRNIEVLLDIFRALEHRDPGHPDMEQLQQLIQPEVELHWPPSLPYGGTTRGLQPDGPAWSDTWDALQPTPAERRMNPRVIGANDRGEVVILYHQRGVSGTGERFDTEVVGVYEIRDGKLARAQMFYFDEAATNQFLKNAARQHA
jgi:ketosteroid isomerase-like protein